MGSSRTTTTNRVANEVKVCIYIYKECVVCRKTEVHLSARWNGAGADDSGSECPTVAHTRAIASSA